MGDADVAVIDRDLDLLNLLQTNIQLAVIQEPDTSTKASPITVSLDGIVFSTIEHHPHERFARPGEMTDAEKKLIAKHSLATFPKPDECVEPKAVKDNMRAKFMSIKDNIKAKKEELADVKGMESGAKTEDQKKQYKDLQTNLMKEMKEMMLEMRQIAKDRKTHEAAYPACFDPNIIAQAAHAAGVEFNKTAHSLPEAIEIMCNETKWSEGLPSKKNTIPACCADQASCNAQKLDTIHMGLIRQLTTKTNQKTSIEESVQTEDSTGMIAGLSAEIKEIKVKQDLVATCEKFVSKLRIQRITSV